MDCQLGTGARSSFQNCTQLAIQALALTKNFALLLVQQTSAKLDLICPERMVDHIAPGAVRLAATTSVLLCRVGARGWPLGSNAVISH